MFKKLMAGLGVGGASVQTVLSSPETRPGGRIGGTVTARGGDVPQDIDRLEVALAAVAEVESGDSEHESTVVFARHTLRGAFALQPGQEERVVFGMDVPIEMPFNVVGGQHLSRVRLGVRTELEIARSRDSTDLDPVRVHALPGHERILQAILASGFAFRGADLEKGRMPGSQLPVYQELEFAPTGNWRRSLNELEVTFITTPHAIDVVLEGDRKGGMFTEGYDKLLRFSVALDGSGAEQAVADALRRLGERRGFLF